MSCREIYPVFEFMGRYEQAAAIPLVSSIALSRLLGAARRLLCDERIFSRIWILVGDFIMLHWRVIARRRNGEQRIVDEYMSRDAAERLRDTLRVLSLFPAVFVEIDDETAPILELDAVGSPP